MKKNKIKLTYCFYYIKAIDYHYQNNYDKVIDIDNDNDYQ